jgi:hypothetical protein
MLSLPGVQEGAHAKEVAVSGPSFGTRTMPGAPPSDYDDVRNGLGCRIIRNAVPWSDFEATKGSYNWDSLDRTIDKVRAAGLKVLIPITGPQPDWAGGGHGAPSGVNLTSFVDLCRAIAYRYRGRPFIEAYEIWNEPNGHGPAEAWTPAQYITVINAVTPAIKSADPNVLVAGPALATLPADGRFARAILADAQASANLDIFTAHAYCRPAAPEVGTSLRGPFDPRIAASLTVLANAGFNKPFWITEMGWQTAGSPAFFNTLAEQARYIVRGAIIIRAHGVRVYQFEYNGTRDAGVLGKPSYAAYKTLNGTVGKGLTSLTRVTHPTAWVYKFTRATLPIGYVLWTVSGTANVTLTGLKATVRRTTMSGTSSIVSTTGGKWTEVAGIDPLYIENI